ncbi:MAG: hypothetical protein GTO60_01470, partial [Gammaproteobacteria bacterium]|nr:hypothetical protein [Gammaproteobacteria bacterium]
ALALDNELGEAYAALGFLKHSMGESESADAAFQRAVALSSNYATAYHWYGNLMMYYIGKFEEGL